MLSDLGFVLASALGIGATVGWLSRREGLRLHAAALAVAAGSVAVGALPAAERAASAEAARRQAMIVGLAPTYALELERHGHARVGFDTPPDDPVYLDLVELEKEWLRVNPGVADIYTMRERPDGSVAFVVDSETDYDHDGVYTGDRESRTAIGEVYDEPDPGLVRALAGEATFRPEPITDRWGTWVSAYVPMRDASGRMEAVLGVDYAAEDWVAAMESARRGSLALAGVLELVVVAAFAWVGVLKRENWLQEREHLATAEAARVKSELLAIVSHEVRTPLGGVIGMAEMLLETSLTDEQQQLARTLNQAGRELLGVVNGVLDYSKGEAGRFEPNLEPADPREAVRSVVALFEGPARSRGLELVATIDEDVPTKLLLDANHVRQMLANLTSNALNHTEVGGVAIQLGSAPGRLLFTVRDTGSGIPPGEIGRLFQPYVQARGSGRKGGTGLGLVICKRLVEASGGSIEVSSQVGRGTEFRVTLPALAPTPSRTRGAAAPSSVESRA